MPICSTPRPNCKLLPVPYPRSISEHLTLSLNRKFINSLRFRELRRLARKSPSRDCTRRGGRSSDGKLLPLGCDFPESQKSLHCCYCCCGNSASTTNLSKENEIPKRIADETNTPCLNLSSLEVKTRPNATTNAANGRDSAAQYCAFPTSQHARKLTIVGMSRGGHMPKNGLPRISSCFLRSIILPAL